MRARVVNLALALVPLARGIGRSRCGTTTCRVQRRCQQPPECTLIADVHVVAAAHIDHLSRRRPSIQDDPQQSDLVAIDSAHHLERACRIVALPLVCIAISESRTAAAVVRRSCFVRLHASVGESRSKPI